MPLDSRLLAKRERIAASLQCKKRKAKWASTSALSRLRKSIQRLTGAPLTHLRKKDEWFKIAVPLKEGLTEKDTVERCNSCVSTAIR
jgi:hypothetical protein